MGRCTEQVWGTWGHAALTLLFPGKKACATIFELAEARFMEAAVQA